jgi:uncharacterized protein DUF1937
MSFTYLASPYSHPTPLVRQERFNKVTRVAAKMMLHGEVVFSPIAHSHPIALAMGSADAPTDHRFWMEQDIPVLRHASKLVVLMLDGWRESKGVGQEIAFARQAMIPIDYVTDCEEPGHVAVDDPPFYASYGGYGE